MQIRFTDLGSFSKKIPFSVLFVGMYPVVMNLKPAARNLVIYHSSHFGAISNITSDLYRLNQMGFRS